MPGYRSNTPAKPCPLPEIEKFSRDAIAKGSKSFGLAAYLFAREERRHARQLYAWCRFCDDVIDGQELGHGHEEQDLDAMQERVAWLRRQTRAAYEGAQDLPPPFLALQNTASSRSIPEKFAQELLDGFALDARGARFESLDDSLTYCYGVAGTVGLMMALIMSVRDEDTLHRAIDLGLAFQMTNIARDVLDDARAGRIYLPLAWLHEAGVSPTPGSILAQPEKIFPLAARLVREADRYYNSAAAGIARLPTRSALAIATARDVYRAIGKKLLREGPQAWQQRVRISGRRKIAYVHRTLLSSPFQSSDLTVSREGLWTRPHLAEDLAATGVLYAAPVSV